MHSPHDVVPRELLTARQVQLMLHVDRSTVYRMADDGRLPAVKVGRQWRFPAHAIRALLHPGGMVNGDMTASSRPPGTARPAGAAPAAPSLPAGPVEPLNPDVASAVVRVAADLLGVMMVVTDMDGHPRTEVTNPCPWFVEHADDPDLLDTCAAEWRQLADDVDFGVRFSVGVHGFECARAFVRSGSTLTGMVLAGGIAPEDADLPGLYSLDGDDRRRVLSALPKVAAALSQPPARDGGPADGRAGGSADGRSTR